jgi:hypothetical protein
MVEGLLRNPFHPKEFGFPFAGYICKRGRIECGHEGPSSDHLQDISPFEKVFVGDSIHFFFLFWVMAGIINIENIFSSVK